MNFGCQLVGHAPPLILKALAAQAEKGTLYCAPNEIETQVAAEICKRFRVEMVRFTNSGTESTSHVLRLARHYTKRDKIIKFEGAFHGVQDALLVSTKPKLPQIGDEMHPNQIPSSFGIPAAVWQNTLIASFNNIESVKSGKSTTNCRGDHRAGDVQRRHHHAGAGIFAGAQKCL
jgi:glutamate-1-semialdehyde 2,1-aminomutase